MFLQIYVNNLLIQKDFLPISYDLKINSNGLISSYVSRYFLCFPQKKDCLPVAVFLIKAIKVVLRISVQICCYSGSSLSDSVVFSL